jgi:hypothetical protein
LQSALKSAIIDSTDNFGLVFVNITNISSATDAQVSSIKDRYRRNFFLLSEVNVEYIVSFVFETFNYATQQDAVDSMSSILISNIDNGLFDQSLQSYLLADNLTEYSGFISSKVTATPEVIFISSAIKPTASPTIRTQLPTQIPTGEKHCFLLNMFETFLFHLFAIFF